MDRFSSSGKSGFSGNDVADTCRLPKDAQNGIPARPQATQEPEAYPLGYAEDLNDARTTLADFSRILLEGVCGSFNEMPLLGRAEANLEDHPTAFFTVHGGNGGIDQVLFATSGR